MNKETAQQAIDEAFTDGIKRLFAVLHTGMTTGGRDSSLEAFRNGLEALKGTHERATTEVEKAFGA